MRHREIKLITITHLANELVVTSLCSPEESFDFCSSGVERFHDKCTKITNVRFPYLSRTRDSSTCLLPLPLLKHSFCEDVIRAKKSTRNERAPNNVIFRVRPPTEGKVLGGGSGDEDH
ncbi:hypothetical protein CEXT_155871 [Caerostris extrusa]|uniref:Uncharacterized protein n=1 Tax=Caerostris extrusa TaxID=172846 RepID=A0AAV4QCP0_CAEEX|nr:hypothetical protein CEXT_155871 [Caerostris extrusa]